MNNVHHELVDQINSLQAANGRMVDKNHEEKKELREQLAKANERVAELEIELKESDDDLSFTQQQLSNYENALEEVQAVFVDSDACPLFEPFTAKNLSNWLKKFAIAQKIEALESLIAKYHAQTYPSQALHKLLALELEQLRKEQEK